MSMSKYELKYLDHCYNFNKKYIRYCLHLEKYINNRMIDNIRWDWGYNLNINKVELENNILEPRNLFIILYSQLLDEVSSRYNEICDYILIQIKFIIEIDRYVLQMMNLIERISREVNLLVGNESNWIDRNHWRKFYIWRLSEFILKYN